MMKYSFLTNTDVVLKLRIARSEMQVIRGHETTHAHNQRLKPWSPLNHLLTHVILVRVACGSYIHTAGTRRGVICAFNDETSVARTARSWFCTRRVYSTANMII